MASRNGHLIIGLIVSGLALIFFWKFLGAELIYIPVLTLIVFVYALLPDIDHNMSSITWLLLILGIIIAWAGYFNQVCFYDTICTKLGVDSSILGLALITITVMATLWLKHRGPTHTIWFCLLSPLLLFLLPDIGVPKLPMMAVAFFACWSHLIADKMPFKISLKAK